MAAEATIERRLAALGAGLDFPRVDTLVDDVLAAIARDEQPAAGRRWRPLLLAAAAVLVVVAVAVAAVPGARHAVARWLGFETLRIERVEDVPDAAPPARLGPATSLDAAAAVVGVVPRIAGGLGEPASVHAPDDRYVAVRYVVDGGDVLVATLPGRLEAGAFGKFVAGGTEVVEVQVAGAPGYWVTGDEHVFAYVDDGGRITEARAAADTLVWQQGDVIVRVEGDLSLDEAQAIAATVDEP